MCGKNRILEITQLKTNYNPLRVPSEFTTMIWYCGMFGPEYVTTFLYCNPCFSSSISGFCLLRHLHVHLSWLKPKCYLILVCCPVQNGWWGGGGHYYSTTLYGSMLKLVWYYMELCCWMPVFSKCMLLMLGDFVYLSKFMFDEYYFDRCVQFVRYVLCWVLLWNWVSWWYLVVFTKLLSFLKSFK